MFSLLILINKFMFPAIDRYGNNRQLCKLYLVIEILGAHTHYLIMLSCLIYLLNYITIKSFHELCNNGLRV